MCEAILMNTPLLRTYLRRIDILHGKNNILSIYKAEILSALLLVCDTDYRTLRY